jgi:hypothetical protein
MMWQPCTLDIPQDHGTAAESWGQRVHPDQMLEWTATIPGWPEVADRVIKTIPQEALVDWKLMYVPGKSVERHLCLRHALTSAPFA